MDPSINIKIFILTYYCNRVKVTINNIKERIQSMAPAKKGDKVKVHYTGTLSDGKIFDSSRDKEPFEFILGHGQVIEGFEDALLGMEIHQIKTFTIPSDKAYGQKKDQLIATIERTLLPENFEPKIGQYLVMQGKDGQKINPLVTDITETNITLDGNHPLAGKDLTFELELLEISN